MKIKLYTIISFNICKQKTKNKWLSIKMILITKYYIRQKSIHFNREECQNQEGQQKHKITLFRNSYKSSSNWNKTCL